MVLIGDLCSRAPPTVEPPAQWQRGSRWRQKAPRLRPDQPIGVAGPRTPRQADAECSVLQGTVVSRIVMNINLDPRCTAVPASRYRPILKG